LVFARGPRKKGKNLRTRFGGASPKEKKEAYDELAEASGDTA